MALRISGALPAVVTAQSEPGTVVVTPVDVTFTEGSNGARSQSFPIRLSAPAPEPISLEFRTEDETARAGSDFLGRTGTITFPVGSTELSVSVSVLADRVAEGAESFRLVLFNPPTGVVFAKEFATATLLDDDLPTVRAGETYRVEGSQGPALARLPLTLSNPSDLPVTVAYGTSGETALPDLDFVPTQGKALFPAGATTLFIDLTVLGDTLTEGHETFRVRLSQPENASLAGEDGRVIILDDDPTPSATITVEPAIEGAPPSPAAEFVVRLSNPSAQAVRLAYETRDDSAKAGADYLFRTGVITLEPGQTEARLGVPLLDDSLPEPSEVFKLLVTSIDGAQIAAAEIPATILDDDQIPSVSVIASAAAEGSGTATNSLAFEVRLSSPPQGSVSVDYTTEAGTASATDDFIPISGKLTFAVFNGRVASHVLRVPLVADNLPEANETVLLRLSSPVGAVINHATAAGTLLNDDGPAVEIHDVSVVEPDTGPAQALVELTLTQPADVPITVDVHTADGTALAPGDYLPTNGVVRFAPGETRQTLAVTLNEDAIAEATEFFEVFLDPPPGATLLRDRARVTLLDRDVPSFSIVPLPNEADPVAEGSSGSPVARFRVQLSGPSLAEAAIRFHTEEGTAREGADFVPIAGTLVFPPGTTSQFVEVPIVADQVAEGTEEFRLVLSEPTLAAIAQDSATATLLDDDPEPIIQVEDIVAAECNGTTGEALFTFRLSARTDQPVNITYRTFDGTAVAGLDYSSAEGTADFTRSSGVATIRVPLACDGFDEPAEFFNLRLSQAENALLLRSNVRAQIIDSDPPNLIVEDVTHLEADAEFSILEIPLSLSSPTDETVTVHYSTLPGSAAAGVDFSPTSGWIVFPPSTVRQVLRLAIGGDAIPEPTETFEVRFDRPSGAQLTRDHLRVTIEDNDLPELAFSGVTVTEGSASPNAARLLVTLSNPSPIEVGVDYAALSGTATSGLDFSPIQGHLLFAPGTTNATLIVPILDDALAEPTESFTVRLSNATNATVGNTESLVTLLDDERPLPPTVSVLDASQNEGDDGWSFLPILLVLSSTNSVPVSVDLASSAETATAGQDFLSLAERVVFPAGTRTQTVFLTLVGDLRRETNETLAVVLSRPSNATLGRTRAQITIRDDDGLRLRIDDLSVVVDRLVATQAVFQIHLSEPASVPVTVDFATRDDTARAGEDYIARSGTLEIAPGETNLLLAIPIAANARDETEESFIVDFLNPTNASLATPFARATLVPAPPASNTPPVVRLLSPSRHEVRDLTDAVTFLAEATDPDDGVSQVEFFANGRLVATVRQPPFEFVWNPPPAGDHVCFARATDATGATTDSQPVTFGVTEVCGRAAILNNAADAETDALADALFELGVPWAIVEPAQASTTNLAPFDLVIWCDDGAAPMGENETRLLQELAASGKSLYFTGDQLLAPSNHLDTNLQESWTQLLRLAPGPPDDAPNRVQLRHDHVQSDVEHPLLHGKAGAITDFDYPFAPETTRLTGAGGVSVLGERGPHPVFIAFETPPTPKARRQITQAFRVGGEDRALQSDRRRLFQNAVWWLLRCPPGDAFNLVPTLRSSTATAVAGQNFDLILEATVSLDCDGLAGRAECLLPADWQVIEVRIDQGSWSQSGRQLNLNLGRLPRGSLITAQITVRPGSAGPQPVRVRWLTLNESPQATADNTLDATVFVEDGIRLTLESTASNTLQLVVQGRGRANYTLEAATDILGPWTVVTRLTPEAGSGTARWMVPAIPPVTHRYFRAR